MITTTKISIKYQTHCNFINVLSSLANVRELELCGVTMMYLPMDDHIKFNRLKKIEFCWRLNCLKDSKVVLCILKNSTALEYLHIWEIWSDFEYPISAIKHFWHRSDILSFKVNKLKIIEMEDFTCDFPGVRFIEFVLGNAHLLEKVCIGSYMISEDDSFDHAKFLNKIMAFPKASARAIVKFNFFPEMGCQHEASH